MHLETLNLQGLLLNNASKWRIGNMYFAMQ